MLKNDKLLEFIEEKPEDLYVGVSHDGYMFYDVSDNPQHPFDGEKVHSWNPSFDGEPYELIATLLEALDIDVDQL